jgi:hypothetical protein
MTTFERVLAYIRSHDSQFAPEGATPEQVDELEALVGAPLPEIYRDFLEVMGRDMDWISIEQIDFRIETVIDYYRHENWLPADRYIRIGSARKDPAFNPHLELSYVSDDPRVVLFGDLSPASFADPASRFRVPFAGSLPEMVCLPVFRMFEIDGEGRRPTYLETPGWRPEAIDQAERLFVETLGFERLWFSSVWGRAYRRDDAAIQAVQLGGYPLQLWVRGDDPAEQARIVRLASETLGIGGGTP